MKLTLIRSLAYSSKYDVARFGKFISITDSLCHLNFLGLIEDVEQKSLILEYPSKDHSSLFSTLLNADKNIFKFSNINDVLKANSELFDMLVHIPLKYDLDVEVKKMCNVSISNLQNNYTNISIGNGNLIIQDLETTKLNSKIFEGSIFVKGLLKANVNFQIGKQGNINGSKLLGNKVHFTTQDGNIKFDSIYSEDNYFKTDAGQIQISNIQGNTIIESISGNAIIDMLDGDLNAKFQNGNISCFANKFNKIVINNEQGNIDLKIGTNGISSFTISAKFFDINENITLSTQTDVSKDGKKIVTGKLMGKEIGDKNEVSSIHLSAPNGHISIKRQSWFESLNLKKQS